MKKLSLALSLAFGTIAFADVPALINYQGRLVNGVGNPVTGSKEFKLDIYDSQTEGTLIYQETLPNITLDEDGAYSFQFGAGESRSETSVIVATGDGEAAFFQKVFEETPVGVISVTDGTNTFNTGDVPTGEEPFNFTYTASLNRLNLVCNEPPSEGTKFTATFRYAESGIIGALGSAAEHWMEVTIGGEKQEPRQRLVAVPFALSAGVAERVTKSEPVRFQTGNETFRFDNGDSADPKNYYPLTNPAKKLLEAKLLYIKELDDAWYPFFEIIRVRKVMWNDYLFGLTTVSDFELEPVWSAARIQPNKLEADSGATITFEPVLYPLETPGVSDFSVSISWGDGIALDPAYFYFYVADSVIVSQRSFNGLSREVFSFEN